MRGPGKPMRSWLHRRACFRRTLRALFSGVVALALLSWGGISTAQAPTDSPSGAGRLPSDRILPLEVTVNGSKSGTWPLLERAGILYAPRDAFEECGCKPTVMPRL